MSQKADEILEETRLLHEAAQEVDRNRLESEMASIMELSETAFEEEESEGLEDLAFSKGSE